jgi:hypothetical protein
MFPGFPQYCKRAAKTPIKTPVPIIPPGVAKKFFPFIALGLLLP